MSYELPLLTVSASPHIRDRDTVSRIMWGVSAALVPAGVIGAYLFGLRTVLLMFISVAAAVVTEGIIQKLRRQEITLNDGSAVLTGLLLAYNLPPGVPYWLPAVGAFVAIAIGKQAFGGLGHNIFNPALIGRVFLLFAWPVEMTTWQRPLRLFFESHGIDTVSRATPLAAIQEAVGTSRITAGIMPDSSLALANFGFSYRDLFLGNCGGCIGEVSALALLAGALYLLYRRYITLHIPLSYLVTAALLIWIFGGKTPFTGDWVFHVLAGGFILGAFFMATDMVTTPITGKGMLIFGVGCGAITFIIRKFSGSPEGVSFSILLMNAAVPLIDHFTRPRKFGT